MKITALEWEFAKMTPQVIGVKNISKKTGLPIRTIYDHLKQNGHRPSIQSVEKYIDAGISYQTAINPGRLK